MARFIPSTRVLSRLLIVPAIVPAVLYYAYRPREISGFEPAAVPPPIYDADGKIHLPRFPAVKSRKQLLDELARSGRGHGHGHGHDEPIVSNGSKGSDGDADYDDNELDMLVIGGGATGTGVALDAATRGLRVALVERDDFSSETSSKSTKLVHGGVRYLEKAVWNLDYAQYQLVREALKERKYFLKTAPHLSSWLPIMLPIYSWWKAPYYWLGTKFYDLLAGSEGIESSYFLTRSKAIAAFPMLNRVGLVGALVYYDGAHNDSRMNVSLAVTASLYGATVVNHAEVTGLLKDSAGRVRGALVRDNLPKRDGQPERAPMVVRAKCVVNCTGPFCDSIRRMDYPDCTDIVQPATGVHVVLPGYYSPARMGLIDPSTSDGRVIFFLPWQGNTIAGTTDDRAAVTRNPVPDEKAIRWILDEVGRYLSPDIRVRRGDVLAAWSGIRPLVKDPKAVNTQSVVRSHLVDISDKSDLMTCAGDKWTTYRQMAEECVDAAVRHFGLSTRPLPLDAIPHISGSLDSDSSLPLASKSDSPAGSETADAGSATALVDVPLDGSCQTHGLRLVGAHGFSKTLFIPLIQHHGLDTQVARHLAESYGDRAWDVAALCAPTDRRFPTRGTRLSPLYPFVDGEVRHAVRAEFAQTAVDVLARRTRLAFLNAQAALEALPAVIDIMAVELGWDRARQHVEWTETVKYLASMGLPAPLLSATRKQVEQAKQNVSGLPEWTAHSRQLPKPTPPTPEPATN